MAVHADTAELMNPAPATDDAVVGTRRRWFRCSRAQVAIAFGACVAVALAALAGWLAYNTSRQQTAADARSLFVEVAKQGAVNLTTISYTEVDKDVQRILDSSIGMFHEDFQHRAQPFIDVVKQARTTSTGAVTAAGLESQDGDRAQVLIAVEVETATNGGPSPAQPRNWRMRITVQKVGTAVKVANVQFVP